MPNNRPFHAQPPPVYQPPAPQPPVPTPPRRRRFRWWIIGLPLLIVALAWAFNSIDVAVTWDNLLSRWGIVNRERFSQLAILGVVICGICLLARIQRNSHRDKGD